MKPFSSTLFKRLNLKLTIAASFFIGSYNAQTLTTLTYTTPGSAVLTIPSCVTSVTVRVWGAGGAGGGAGSTDRNGGGGGGGAYSTFTETVTPGEDLRITVGAGGAGVSNGNGNAGGSSQVEHVTGSVVFCRASGGAGGTRGGGTTSPGSGGAGGAISGNIPAGTGFSGGNGGNSISDATSVDRGGGGGGGAGTGGNGSNGISGDNSTALGGLGAGSGGGNGGNGSSTTGAGVPGNPGNSAGGGGGGASAWNSSAAGGSGANGKVTVTYTATGCEPPTSTFNYSTVGTYNWVVPACVNFVTVEAWGGGGGGGGNIAVLNQGTETCTGAGGGGGGGYAGRTYAVTPGESYTIVVGAGGTAGPAGANGGGGSAITTPAGNGGNGGNSTFSGPATAGPGVLTGSGGTGGFGAGTRNNTSGSTCALANGNGGTGGTGLNGSLNYTGGNGAAGLIYNLSTDRSGGGGGAAGPGGNGGNAPALSSLPSAVSTPPGGNGDTPGGSGGTGRYYNVPSTQAYNGVNGNDFGGGAGGSLIHRGGFGVSTAIGGVGGRGEVRLTYNTTCPLPVELMHFGGKNKGEFNELVWITASESINDYFTLERSINGADWEKVATVKGAGTTQEIQNYSYDDRGYTRGIVNYYRLSQTDTDGSQEYVGGIIPINNRFSHLKVVARYNLMGQEVGEDAKGVVITLYEDGTTERNYVD